MPAIHFRLGTVEAGKRVWPGRWWQRAGDMVRADLEAVGLSYKFKEEGQADSHALRSTGITYEYNRTKDPKRTQTWARHSTINPTMETCTSARRLGPNDTLAALLGVPAASDTPNPPLQQSFPVPTRRRLSM